MAFFGLFSKKEVNKIEENAWQDGNRQGQKTGRDAVLQDQQSDLANIAKGSQVKFSIPYFDVFDPRYENFAVPVAVHGMVVYAVDDISKFNSINKTQNVSDATFQEKLKGQITKYVKDVVTNAPEDNNIPVLKLERKIVDISELIQRLVTPKIEQLFGVNVRSIDITEILVDKNSRGYRELNAVSSELEKDSIMSRYKRNKLEDDLEMDALKRRHEMQMRKEEGYLDMDMDDDREWRRIEREEKQREARLDTESRYLSAHQANLNADVANTKSMFAQQTSQMSQMPGMPQMPGMGGMPPMPGSVPQVQYMVNVNNQATGPFNWNQLQQLVQQGQLTQQSYVWKQGMAQWDMAGNVAELQPLFGL